MAVVYAVCNQKGGVAKTLTSVSLGIGLAREGKKVLLVDIDALKKDPQKGQYIVFFRARDADTLNAAFAEYTARTLKQQQKPSLLKQLAKFKQMVQQMAPGKEKHRAKGSMEH